jgi:flagellar assembly protein FliH
MFVTGRVLLGVGSPGGSETTIQELEGKKRPIWNDATSEEYLTRVRDKAQEAAREVIARAMAEAEVLRREAADKGRIEGETKAKDRQAEVERAQAEQLAKALSGIKNQAKAVWRAQRRDIVALIRLAVEKTLAVEIEERRAEILENLLDQSLDLLDTRRRLTIKTRPEDAALIEKLLKEAKDRHPDLSGWRLKPSPELAPGGLVVECDEGMVDNAIASRFAEVEAIFAHLVVPDKG